jgi:hypothetical protein
MKKLLVLFVSAALVLSMAAVSLAAVTFNGDFRYNMYEDESSTLTTNPGTGSTPEQSYGETDLRFKINGDISETVKAFANLRIMETNNSGWTTKWDEAWATAKFNWGTAKMGYYEYKFTPSRSELSSSGMKVTPKNDTTFEFDIPLAEGFRFDTVFLPYATSSTDDGSYAVTLAYTAENWGIQASYWDLKKSDYDLSAIDVYYMINDNMKVFVDGTDYSYNDETATHTATLSSNTIRYDDGLDPVIGFSWSKIADTKLNAVLEYAINSRYDVGEAEDFNEWIFNCNYKLSNGINLVYYHYIVGSDETKDMFRFQYCF